MQKEWRLAAVEAADAAVHRRGKDEEFRRAKLRARQPAAEALGMRVISLERGLTSPRVDGKANRRFHDSRSRRQIAAYLAHRLLASDQRNLRALARWNDNVRQQWELEHLGSSRQIT